MARAPQPPLRTGSAPPRLLVGVFFVGWVDGPWVAASALIVLALRLLLDEDFNLHSHAWGLFGNAAICFSIGCLARTSLGISERPKS